MIHTALPLTLVCLEKTTKRGKGRSCSGDSTQYEMQIADLGAMFQVAISTACARRHSQESKLVTQYSLDHYEAVPSSDEGGDRVLLVCSCWSSQKKKKKKKKKKTKNSKTMVLKD
ncbi:hypothetical protein B296_00039231 [Ensete ventricosum]|uniref:Uncharacterized protein n=1 Tax=Ensete ventricosum TaxID=4639 RepID=A0A426YQ73_ENSVE|nr:hypothetical protein B296_00039231 [Ensete ventricosum]